MRNKIIYLAIFLCIIPSLAYADKTLTLTDTSGKINLKVKVSKEDICYSVFHPDNGLRHSQQADSSY